MDALKAPGVRYRPCVVLAHSDASFFADAHRRFRRLGWEVYQAGAGPELRRLVRMLEPDLVVLDVNLGDESGWLTCAKLTQERPKERVVLVADDDGPRSKKMATFVGARAVVARTGGLNALMQQGWGQPEALAG